MALGVEKRVRSEYGEPLKDTGPGGRGGFTLWVWVLALVAVLAVGGIAYLDHRMESSQEALRTMAEDFRGQRDALQAKLSALEKISGGLQQRIERLEKAPEQMEQAVLRATLYDISQKISLLKALPSFPPEMKQALSRIEAEMKPVLRQAGVFGQ